MAADQPHSVEITVRAENDRFDPDDDRWSAQANDLYEDLRREVTGFQAERIFVDGTKGAVETVILALGTAGAFRAAVDCFRAWLARDKSRRIVVTFNRNGREERIAIEADAVDSETFQRLGEALGGPK